MTIRQALKALWTMGQGVSKGIGRLDESADPIDLFNEWFSDARASGILEPEAMALATATPGAAPSVRMVLLKGVEPDGFLFYTNYESRKAGELDANPQAALAFHWVILQRQVRVEGTVERVDPETSNRYFQSRLRGSRIGAWASRQSRRLERRGDLEQAVAEYEEKFKGAEVPLPEFWGGYRIRPHRIEFWQGRTHRLHDRLVFERENGTWTTHRLYP